MQEQTAHPPVSYDRAIGSALRWVRGLRGVGRAEFAEKLEMSERTLAAIESGARRLKAGEKMLAAHLLDVPLSWLDQPLPETVALEGDGGPDGPDGDAMLPDSHSGAYRDLAAAVFTNVVPHKRQRAAEVLPFRLAS